MIVAYMHVSFAVRCEARWLDTNCELSFKLCEKQRIPVGVLHAGIFSTTGRCNCNLPQHTRRSLF